MKDYLFRAKPVWHDNQVYWRLLPSARRKSIKLGGYHRCKYYYIFADRFTSKYSLYKKKRNMHQKWCSGYLDKKYWSNISV